MNFWTRMFSRKESQAQSLVSVMGMGKPVNTPRNYASFADEGYQKNVIAFRAIHSVASACASIPWILKKKALGSNADHTEILDHPLLTLLKKPNPMQGQSEFIESMVGFKLIAGNAYVEAVGPVKGSTNGPAKELWSLRPDRMQVVPGVGGLPGAYVYKVNQSEVSFSVDRIKGQSAILHWKFFNPLSDWYGMSPIEAAVMGIDQHNAANRWNLSLLQNSARPSGALVATVSDKSTGNLSPDQFSRLKDQIDSMHSGGQNAGRPMLLEGGLDWKQFSLTPAQMDWIENVQTSSRDISRAFGVPPMLLSIPGDNTYSNYSEARTAFYEDTVLPTMDGLKDALNRWLTPRFGDGLELGYDKDDIHALAPRRMEIWDKVNTAAWLTVNEKRAATGYEEVDDGDMILIPSGMQTLDSLEDGTPDPDAPDPASQGPGEPAPADDSTEDDSEEETEVDPQSTAKPKSGAQSNASKIVDLKTPAARQKEAKAQNRMRAGFEAKLHRQVQAVLEMEGHRVKTVCQGIDASHAERAAAREIDANRDQWKTILKSNLVSAAKTMGARVLKELKAGDGPSETKGDKAQTRFDYYVEQWIENHLGDEITGIADTSKEEVLAKLREVAQENLDEGAPNRDLAQSIEDLYGSWADGGRAETIARTEIGFATSAGSIGAARSSGISNLSKEWVAVNDDRTREDHVAADGQTVGIDEKFVVGGDELDRPCDDQGDPSEVINCFLPGTIVRGAFVAGIRSKYIGPITHIATRSGKRLSVTPNHPVLTSKGFVPAGSLGPSDQLIAYSSVIDVYSGLTNDDYDNEPVAIENVFKTLGVDGTTTGRHLTSDDLHGDAKFVAGQVDIVRSNRFLLNEYESTISEVGKNSVFMKKAVSVSRLSSSGASELGIDRVATTSSGLPGFSELPSDENGTGLNGGPLDPLRFGLTPRLNSVLSEMSLKASSGNPDGLTDLVHGSAGLVAFDEISEVWNEQFSGHVYDLQSTSGLLLAEGLITSNCRCAMVYVRDKSDEADNAEGNADE